MYPSSSSSSSSHSSIGGPSAGGNRRDGGGLNRYGSAPTSLLTTAVDSAIGQPRNKEFSPLGSHRYFSSDTSAMTSESNCKTTAAGDHREHNLTMNGLQRSYGSSPSPSTSNSSPLIRHSSLPAGFLNVVASAVSNDNNGFSVTRGIGTYTSQGGSDNACGIQRLNSQLSFTRPDSLSLITEESEDADDDIRGEGHRKAAHGYATANFGLGSWDNSSTIMFSPAPGKRAKTDNGGGLHLSESQFQFGLSQTALDMASMEHMMDIPHDSVPCKARAKRGCATHPRSIAERERRTRISGKLKKLQDLVPNMDKQTSYADMLDLAVQHIKGLQTQVQKLNNDLEHCTCGCKQTAQCKQ